MKYKGFSYLVGEGFRNIFKNTKSSSVSIITMICTMFLFGVAFAIGMNVDNILEQVQLKQGMRVFIFDEATDEQKMEFETEIRALDGVNSVTVKSKEMALEEFKAQMKDYQSFLDAYEGENNIFPASYVVTLTDLKKSDEIEKKITELGKSIKSSISNEEEIDLETTTESTVTHDSIIKNIESSDNTIAALITIAQGVKYAIAAIFVVLLVISVTIISNTIKLTVYSRRKEIEIMRYVGATNNFIRFPFIVEGIVIGIIAAIITLVIVGGLYDFVIQNIEASKVLQKMGITLVRFVELAKSIAVVYAALGVGIGVLGSSLSMKKYLEV